MSLHHFIASDLCKGKALKKRLIDAIIIVFGILCFVASSIQEPLVVITDSPDRSETDRTISGCRWLVELALSDKAPETTVTTLVQQYKQVLFYTDYVLTTSSRQPKHPAQELIVPTQKQLDLLPPRQVCAKLCNNYIYYIISCTSRSDSPGL